MIEVIFSFLSIRVLNDGVPEGRAPKNYLLEPGKRYMFYILSLYVIPRIWQIFSLCMFCSLLGEA